MPVLLKKRHPVTEPVMLFWNKAPPCVPTELLLNSLSVTTLMESACATAPPDWPAVFSVKLEAVMFDWLPESTKMAPPADKMLCVCEHEGVCVLAGGCCCLACISAEGVVLRNDNAAE